MITNFVKSVANIFKGITSKPIPYPFPEPTWFDYVAVKEKIAEPETPKPAKIKFTKGRKFKDVTMVSTYGFGDMYVGETIYFTDLYNEEKPVWYKRIQAAASAYGRYNNKQFKTRLKGNGRLVVERIR